MASHESIDIDLNARLLTLARQLRTVVAKRPEALAQVVSEWLGSEEPLEAPER